ncbi:hypothetical protein DTL42_23020 [Bremerella cremea]|uniref:Uncharacterized protein n=1 Tax=Bremerella cremea TaxID=1031537 RepID=A0A368KNL3_9BACT|nr:hypothetical protein [Bremerella cremea]RCS41432.1 hypothetical protein DTL42_23020 [Bremerella cremea]
MMKHQPTCICRSSAIALVLFLLATSPAQAEESESQACFTLQQKVIDTKISVDATKMRLDDFAELVERESKIPIRIDGLSLEEYGLTNNETVNAQYKNASLHSVLLWTLRQHDLTYYVDSDEVVITTADTVEDLQQTRFHPVAKLLGDSEPDYDSLIEMTCAVVKPPSWEELGGPSSIAPINGGLVARQITQNHLLLDRLYEQLAQSQAMPVDNYEVKPRLVTLLPAESVTLREQLDSQQIEIAFDQVPLGKAIEDLRKATGLNLVLDSRALEDIGLDAECSVTLQARKRSVARTLELMLAPLVYMVQDDVVIVTTESEQESSPEIRVYPVRDLVWRGLDKHEPQLKQILKQFYPPITASRNNSNQPYRDLLPSPVLDSIPTDHDLQELITTTIEPESWEELGGPGSIKFLPSADCFVVSQSAPIHEKLADTLEQIRQHSPPLDLNEFGAALDRENNEVLTVTFSLDQSRQGTSLFQEADMQEIARQIKIHVEPRNWNRDEYFVETLQDKVTIRHRREVVRKVLAWLINQGILTPRITGYSCRGPLYGGFIEPSPPSPHSETVPVVPSSENQSSEAPFGASPTM